MCTRRFEGKPWRVDLQARNMDGDAGFLRIFLTGVLLVTSVCPN